MFQCSLLEWLNLHRWNEQLQLSMHSRLRGWQTGASFQLFLGGPKIFLVFNATGLLKNWKKQHFICSNLTLFIVPFNLSSFFLFFLSFFLFSFSLGGGDGPQPPSNDAPGDSCQTGKWDFKCVLTNVITFRTLKSIAPVLSSPHVFVHSIIFDLIWDVNDCSSTPCFNNGTCIDGINSFRCDCVPPFLEEDNCQSGKL